MSKTHTKESHSEFKLRAKEKSFPFLFIQNDINSAFAKNFEKCYSSYCLLGGYLPPSATYTSVCLFFFFFFTNR